MKDEILAREIGMRMKRCRLRCRYTQTEVKELIQKPSLRLGDYEKGIRMPSVPVLLELSEVYRVRVSDFLPDGYS